MNLFKIALALLLRLLNIFRLPLALLLCLLAPVVCWLFPVEERDNRHEMTTRQHDAAGQFWGYCPGDESVLQ